MRGKQKSIKTSASKSGITPAHAGKTGIKAAFNLDFGDHPRACGENPLNFCTKAARSGSPPRMRGKLKSGYVIPGGGGITPAHAGKTCFVTIGTRRYKDHPRACGENKGLCWEKTRERGSPPRMRGKRTKMHAEMVDGGITPAHAGKTPHRNRSPSPPWDHPRACGENDVR